MYVDDLALPPALPLSTSLFLSHSLACSLSAKSGFLLELDASLL